MKTKYKVMFALILLFSSIIHAYSVYNVSVFSGDCYSSMQMQIQYTPDPIPGNTPLPTGVLDIIVVDSITGEPLNNVSISISTEEGANMGGSTNMNGGFYKDHSSYTATTAELKKSGYDTLIIDANSSGTIELVATVPDPDYHYEVRGTVIDLNTGDPLENAGIRLSGYHNDRYYFETVYTDQAGHYFLTAEKGTTATITVSRPSYISDALEIEPGIHIIDFSIEQTAPGAGDVWIYPSSVTVRENRAFTVEIHANVGTQALVAYSFDLSYNANSLFALGYDAGADGFVSVTAPGPPGTIIMNGYDAMGTAIGEDIHLLTITFSPGAPGTSSLEISHMMLQDTLGTTIGIPHSIGNTVTIVTPAFGDVNNDNSVDIVDALLVAQYYVSEDSSILDLSPADVNNDGSVDIVDALLIAQFYVGLIYQFE